MGSSTRRLRDSFSYFLSLAVCRGTATPRARFLPWGLLVFLLRVYVRLQLCSVCLYMACFFEHLGSGLRAYTCWVGHRSCGGLGLGLNALRDFAWFC